MHWEICFLVYTLENVEKFLIGLLHNGVHRLEKKYYIITGHYRVLEKKVNARISAAKNSFYCCCCVSCLFFFMLSVNHKQAPRKKKFTIRIYL